MLAWRMASRIAAVSRDSRGGGGGGGRSTGFFSIGFGSGFGSAISAGRGGGGSTSSGSGSTLGGGGGGVGAASTASTGFSSIASSLGSGNVGAAGAKLIAIAGMMLSSLGTRVYQNTIAPMTMMWLATTIADDNIQRAVSPGSRKCSARALMVLRRAL